MSQLTRRIALLPAATGVTPTYDTDAAAYFAAMTVQPDATRKGLLNTLIVALKACGAWATYDFFYVGASHDAQAMRINAKNPATYTLQAVNSPVFLVDRWIGSNAGGGYWLTGFNPGTTLESTRQMKDLTFSFGFWRQVDTAAIDNGSLGAYDGAVGGLTMSPRTTGGATSYRAKTLALTVTAAPASFMGQFTARRTNDIISFRKDKVQISGQTLAPSSNFANETFRLGNISGATAQNSRAAFVEAGGYKDDATCDAEYDAKLSYLTAIGAA